MSLRIFRDFPPRSCVLPVSQALVRMSTSNKVQPTPRVWVGACTVCDGCVLPAGHRGKHKVAEMEEEEYEVELIISERPGRAGGAPRTTRALRAPRRCETETSRSPAQQEASTSSSGRAGHTTTPRGKRRRRWQTVQRCCRLGARSRREPPGLRSTWPWSQTHPLSSHLAVGWLQAPGVTAAAIVRPTRRRSRRAVASLATRR